VSRVRRGASSHSLPDGRQVYLLMLRSDTGCRFRQSGRPSWRPDSAGAGLLRCAGVCDDSRPSTPPSGLVGQGPARRPWAWAAPGPRCADRSTQWRRVARVGMVAGSSGRVLMRSGTARFCCDAARSSVRRVRLPGLRATGSSSARVRGRAPCSVCASDSGPCTSALHTAEAARSLFSCSAVGRQLERVGSKKKKRKNKKRQKR